MSISFSATPAVYALGNFDGVHRGHCALIAASVDRARTLGVPARVLTFEPHPRRLFQPDAPPFRLTNSTEKVRLLRACGIDDVVTLPFTTEFAKIEAQDFVETILLKQLQARHVFAGHDFTFGRNRVGDMQKLAQWLVPHNVGVTEFKTIGDTQAFSSTRIRSLLQQGDVTTAAEILGRDWAINGVVMNGAQRGRTIGVPTANIVLGDYLRPQFGVYAVRAGRAGEALIHKGVANIGIRPTVGGQSENLEAHIFDFDQDIYGQEWQFTLTRFIRPERKFDGLEALKVQIALDIASAK